MHLASLGLVFMLASPSIAVLKEEKTWWVFLVKGVRPAGITETQLEAMQNAHIENFKRLFGEGKLLTAGPLKDPTQMKRGIVLLSVATMSDVRECFKPDPYVQSGTMTVDARLASVEFGKIEKERIDPETIEENRIVIFTKGTEKGVKRSAKAYQEWLSEAGKKAGLAYYVSFKRSKDIQGIGLFRGADDANLDQLLKANPMIVSGGWVATKMPQWLSKGVLGTGEPK